MTNDFSEIPAESNLRDEITVQSDEFDPVANPAYDGSMGVMTDYDDCDSDDDSDDAVEMEPDESMDGDHESGLASAGLGYDEQYEHNLCDDCSGE